MFIAIKLEISTKNLEISFSGMSSSEMPVSEMSSSGRSSSEMSLLETSVRNVLLRNLYQGFPVFDRSVPITGICVVFLGNSKSIKLLFIFKTLEHSYQNILIAIPVLVWRFELLGSGSQFLCCLSQLNSQSLWTIIQRLELICQYLAIFQVFVIMFEILRTDFQLLGEYAHSNFNPNIAIQLPKIGSQLPADSGIPGSFSQSLLSR